MKSLLEKTTRFRGLLVLVLWQAAPVGIDEYGRTRVGFGFGAGRLEFAALDCEGSVLESETVSYRSAAANVEHWVSPKRVLLHASLGYSASDSLDLHGPFGAVTLSSEWQHFGIGGGVAFVPGTDFSGAESEQQVELYPSVYIRGGNRDRLHVRTELFPPSLQTHVIPWCFVVGYNQFGRSKPSGAVGFGLIGTDDPTGGVVAEGLFPVATNTQLGFHGFLSPGRENAQGGIAAQLKFTLK